MRAPHCVPAAILIGCAAAAASASPDDAADFLALAERAGWTSAVRRAALLQAEARFGDATRVDTPTDLPLRYALLQTELEAGLIAAAGARLAAMTPAHY